MRKVAIVEFLFKIEFKTFFGWFEFFIFFFAKTCEHKEYHRQANQRPTIFGDTNHGTLLSEPHRAGKNRVGNALKEFKAIRNANFVRENQKRRKKIEWIANQEWKQTRMPKKKKSQKNLPQKKNRK